MTVARPYGTGTYTEVAPHRFRLRVSVRDPITGKSRQVSKTITVPARAPKGAIEEELRHFQEEVRKDQGGGSTAPFGRLLDEWLAQSRRLGRAKTTLETYGNHIERHIRPALGDVPIGELSAHDLDSLYGKLALGDGVDQRPLAVRTIRLNHAVIRAALQQGVDWGWLDRNPATSAKPPTLDRQERPGLSVDDLQRLLRAAAEEDADMATIIAMAALTGARRGELCGLRWSDVDWTAGTLRIERAWVTGVGGQHLTTTKTKRGRTVALGSVGLALLRRYESEKVAVWGSLDPDGWMLCYGDGSKPMRAKTLTGYVTDLGRRLDPPLSVHFHEFRHFAASELLGAGVDLKTAAARMGHSPTVLAEIYAHSTDDRNAAAAELLGAVVARALPTGP
jgi:integrase